MIRERDIRSALNARGWFKQDGCWTPVYISKGGAQVVSHYVQVNRKYRRSRGVTSY